MSYIFARVQQVTRRWVWALVVPVLTVCSADNPAALITPDPGTVSDLSVAAATDVMVLLSFTQVDDGSGQPAKYDLRYGVAPMSWGSTPSAASGSCAVPVGGTAVGGNRSCTVTGLTPATNYNFQVIAFRGTLNGTAAFGGISNVAAASTLGSPPPASVVTIVTVSPSSASVAVGGTSTLQAMVKDQYGAPMTGQTVTWSSDNSAAAAVSSAGVVSGVAAGSATITASSSGKSGTAAITVTATPPPAPVVTTVTVSPPSASVVAGATVTLQATVSDQNSNIMTGQTITWSSNSANATVNTSGVVTGASAGPATITATSSGKSGTSSITVTAAPPPGGGTILFSEDFENADLGSRGWYDNTTVLLTTTEHMAGSTASAQYRFLAGATTPTSGNAQRHKFAASNSLYISYYVKYSANWVGSGQSYHPHEFYAMSTLDGDYDGPSQNFMTIYLEHNYQNGGKPVMSMQDNRNINSSYGPLPHNLVGVTETRSTGGCNGMAESNMGSECFSAGSSWYNLKQASGPVVFQPNPGPGYKNSWNFVEAYFQLNTVVGGIGQADGVMQYWFNGTLIIDRRDILFRTGAHPTLQFNQFLIGPYIGDGSPVDQSIFIDNLRVGTARVP